MYLVSCLPYMYTRNSQLIGSSKQLLRSRNTYICRTPVCARWTTLTFGSIYQHVDNFGRLPATRSLGTGRERERAILGDRLGNESISQSLSEAKDQNARQ